MHNRSHINAPSFSPPHTYLIFSFEHDLAATSKERLFDFSLICVRINFCCCCSFKKTNVIEGWHHTSLVLGESIQKMLLHPVSQQHRNTARLSLITNKETEIFQDHCSGQMNDNCAESCGTLWESSFYLCTFPSVYYQALDPPRLQMTINKIEVFVYSSADCTGDKSAVVGIYSRCELLSAQLQQPIRSFKCLVLRDPCVSCCC